MDTTAVDTTKGMSLGERLMAGREEKRKEHEFEAKIDLGGGYIEAFYRPLDFREERKIVKRHQAVRDDEEREIRMAAETLVVACLRCEAHVDDETHDVPPLGLRLTQHLGVDGPETDIQAVLALFPTESAMVAQCLALERWTNIVNQAVNGDIAGNSEAATS